MKIFNKVLQWYVHNILSKNLENYDSEGMLVLDINTQAGKVYNRIILVPEDIVINLENELLKKDKNYEKKLYSIGKNIGYNNAAVFKSPTLSSKNEKEIRKFLSFIINFNFSTWTKNVDIEHLDVRKKEMVLHYKGHVVCHENGKGFILTSGLDAGFASYVFADPKIEAIQKKCEGRGDNYCEEIIGNSSFLKKHHVDSIKAVPKTFRFDERNYKKFNALRKCKYATTSLKKLIEEKIFHLSQMHIRYEGLSFINITDVFLYVLETSLSPKEKNILYNVSFEVGKSIKFSDLNFITDFISALGWGDLLIQSSEREIQLYLNLFPWHYQENMINDFSMISGFISGMLSSLYKKNIKLRKIRKIYHEERFGIRIY